MSKGKLAIEAPVTVTSSIVGSDRFDSISIRSAMLTVRKGPDRGLKLALSDHGVVVGSEKSCDLCLSDEGVSRRHFEIIPQTTGYLIRDLGSMNGTFLRGIRITEAILTEGLDIELGRSRLRLTLLDQFDEFPLSPHSAFGKMLGPSAAMRRVFTLLESATGADLTLLLTGETGTGKDLAAETVHGLSRRRDAPFIVVDCGAITASLLASELFGHKKGAFTGAERDRVGSFEAAAGGTLFLDEIGELDVATQPMLLRFLESRQIKRLGENRYRPVDVRLIVATNRDLDAEVKAGRFRQDLFFRLSVLRVRMPSLRERPEDIAFLARHFVQKLKPELDPDQVLSEQILAMLYSHSWAGNVRELRNVVERLLVVPYDKAFLREAEPAPSLMKIDDLLRMPFHHARKAWVERFEKQYLSFQLHNHQGVVTRAAKKSEMARETFHRLMAKHGLKKKQ